MNFSLCYLPTAGRLTVTVIRASNLRAMDLTGFSGGGRGDTGGTRAAGGLSGAATGHCGVAGGTMGQLWVAVGLRGCGSP